MLCFIVCELVKAFAILAIAIALVINLAIWLG